MAPTLLRMLVFFPLLSVLRLWLFPSASALEINKDPREITCDEGLTECHMSSVAPFATAPADPDDLVDVTDVKLKVFLCCLATDDCKPCLQINFKVQVAEEKNADVSEESGDSNNEDESNDKVEIAEGGGHKPKALVKVHLSRPYFDKYASIEFALNQSSLRQSSDLSTHNKVSVIFKEELTFGSPVLVEICSRSNGIKNNHNITVPLLEEVCPMNHNAVKECDAPILNIVTDYERNLVFLKLNSTEPRQGELMCQMVWNERPGEFLQWPKGKTEKNISSNLVAPCLCFQVWWRGKDVRREFCPFKKQQDAHERMQHSVYVTMVESAMRDGDTGLSWTVTAPCKLNADVWLCKKDVVKGQCAEVTGFRQTLHNRANWTPTHNGHWNKSGEFSAASHSLLCIQIKIGNVFLEPHCPFETPRWRWSLLVLIGLLLICLAILGAYFIQGVLKGYVWRWLKEEDVKGAVGGGHVILLYPPDDDKALPGLMCHLGSSLQALGFSVSLDLWSQAELGALGAVPWLHSRLDQLKRQGGKVVLVLTKGAWIRAEEWGAHGCERNTLSKKNRNTEEVDAGKGYLKSPFLPCVDVFSASLSCILADYLQGRAGERFTLVQFESLPPEPPGGFRPLPELFRGLHLYSLPSQSLGFLTELAGARQVATASARRKKAGGLRMASRALASGLSSFTAGTTVLHFAGVPQSCVVGAKDSGDTVPLQSCLLTPPSSPDTSPNINKMARL